LRVERRRPQREVARIELVDVDADIVRAAESEMVAAGAHVADRHRHLAAQFTLQVH